MLTTRIKIDSPVGLFVNVIGLIVFIAGVFTAVYYFSISNYIFTIWSILGGLVFLGICSGIAELIYQLLKIRMKITGPPEKKKIPRPPVKTDPPKEEVKE